MLIFKHNFGDVNISFERIETQHSNSNVFKCQHCSNMTGSLHTHLLYLLNILEAWHHHHGLFLYKHTSTEKPFLLISHEVVNGKLCTCWFIQQCIICSCYPSFVYCRPLYTSDITSMTSLFTSSQRGSVLSVTSSTKPQPPSALLPKNDKLFGTSV